MAWCNGARPTTMTTITKVAQLAGVSTATVSKVLNNRPYVSAEKRARVQRVIAELGYVPSARARGLSKRRSMVFGLLIPYTPDIFFADPHLLACMRGAEGEANLHDYNLLLSTARAPEESFIACARLLRSDVIDGAIVVETIDLQPYTEALSHKEAPLVVIGYPPDPAIPAVHADDYGGALAAMRHLLALGHRRVAVIGSVLRPYALEERMRGIHNALASAGLALDPRLIAHGDFSVESGVRAAHSVLSLPERPTAVFALNDRMALGVIRAALERGLQVPDDLSVVGFDDISLAAHNMPPLTTVRQPGMALGQAAAQLFFAQLDGTPPPTTVIPTDLIIRESTCAHC